MKSTIFLPKQINVGYQKRDGTYTGKLAYVIYFDEKGVLRKEASWNSWRHKDIENNIYDNEPIEGFVINKKVGGYDTGWNHRQTYTRIYDPRGFEFEITVDNLLYILENTNSIIGKGLEGKFVYGWDKKDLILIPCNSPDYKQIKEYSKKVENRVSLKGKDLVIGASYLTKDNQEIIYVGKFDCEEYSYRNEKYNTSKKYFFANRYKDEFRFSRYTGLNHILDVTSDKCCDDYADIWSKFEYYEDYNRYDKTKDEYIPHTLKSFTKYCNNEVEDEKTKSWWHENRGISIYFYSENGAEISMNDGWGGRTVTPHLDFYVSNGMFKQSMYKTTNGYGKGEWVNTFLTIEEVFEKYQPHYKKEYLKDGKLRRINYYE